MCLIFSSTSRAGDTGRRVGGQGASTRKLPIHDSTPAHTHGAPPFRCNAYRMCRGARPVCRSFRGGMGCPSDISPLACREGGQECQRPAGGGQDGVGTRQPPAALIASVLLRTALAVHRGVGHGGVAECRSVQSGLFQICEREVRARQVRALQVGLEQVGPPRGWRRSGWPCADRRRRDLPRRGPRPSGRRPADLRPPAWRGRRHRSRRTGSRVRRPAGRLPDTRSWAR